MANFLILGSGLANRPKKQLDYMSNFTELASKSESIEGKTF